MQECFGERLAFEAIVSFFFIDALLYKCCINFCFAKEEYIQLLR